MTAPAFEDLRDPLLDSLFDTGQIDWGSIAGALSVLVYGVSYRQETLFELGTMKGDPRICLVRDVGNEYSRHAIAVISNRGKIGYLPDAVAEILAPHLDGARLQLELVHAELTWFERGGENLTGMRIEFLLSPWSDDLLNERS